MNEPNNEAKWVLGLTAVASLMVALDALVLSTALTEIGRAFDASIEWLEWTANAYILSFAVLLITAAAIGDRFGRRRLFAEGMTCLSLRPQRALRPRASVGSSRRGPCKALAPQ
jgi:MFS family permease